jgi:hypothetical protein
MKIASSDLHLASAHSSIQYDESYQNLYLRNGNGQLQASEARGTLGIETGSARVAARQDAREEQAAAARALADKVSLSAAAKAAQASQLASAPKSYAARADDMARDWSNPKLMLIRAMLEMWLGHSIHIFAGPPGQQATGDGGENTAPVPQQTALGRVSTAQPGVSGLYTTREIHAESEQTTFSASGTVKTADGREINFQLQLAMSRSYYEETTTSILFGQTPNRLDPLVINFAGSAAQLTDQRFAFDLYADGTMQQINFVAPGSGFLVFDRNGEGVINDGSELFGPATGNGFAELAAFDDDGNGWIDENDAIFSQLQIWIRDPQGKDQLLSLAEAGIGAISLTRVATPFDIKTTGNELLGQIQTSGIYLQENGMVGSIQQVDLTV